MIPHAFQSYICYDLTFRYNFELVKAHLSPQHALKNQRKREVRGTILRSERDFFTASHRLTLTLAKLTQHLKVRSAMPLGSSKNTIIAEFDVVEIRQ